MLPAPSGGQSEPAGTALLLIDAKTGRTADVHLAPGSGLHEVRQAAEEHFGHSYRTVYAQHAHALAPLPTDSADSTAELEAWRGEWEAAEPLRRADELETACARVAAGLRGAGGLGARKLAAHTLWELASVREQAAALPTELLAALPGAARAAVRADDGEALVLVVSAAWKLCEASAAARARAHAPELCACILDYLRGHAGGEHDERAALRRR